MIDVDGFLDRVRMLTGGRGVDVVVDPVGGDRFPDSLRALAAEGRVIVLGFTGRSIPSVTVNRLLLRNIGVLGAGSMEHWTRHPDYPAEQWRELWPLLADRTLDPPIAATYPLDRVADALRDIDERRAAGRVLVAVR